jgi:hypothetical protein
MSHRRVVAASIALALACGSRSAAAQRCAHDPAPPLHALLAALPTDAVGPFAQPLSDVRVVMANLSGAGPSEAVVTAWRAGGQYGPEDILWVFSRREGAWRLQATDLSAVNRASGNVDARGRRGNVVVEPVRRAGCRELLRVERLRTNFQDRPQSSRSFELYALESSRLRPVFGCFTRDVEPRFTVGFQWQSGALSLWSRPARARRAQRYLWRDGRFLAEREDGCRSRSWTE